MISRTIMSSLWQIFCLIMKFYDKIIWQKKIRYETIMTFLAVVVDETSDSDQYLESASEWGGGVLD